MKRNFQLGNVPLSSQEGEKADYICMLDGMRILIYFDVRLASEGFKLEDSSIWDLSRVHTGAPWDSENAAWLPSADVQQEVIEDTTAGHRAPAWSPADGLHLLSSSVFQMREFSSPLLPPGVLPVAMAEEMFQKIPWFTLYIPMY